MPSAVGALPSSAVCTWQSGIQLPALLESQTGLVFTWKAPLRCAWSVIQSAGILCMLPVKDSISCLAKSGPVRGAHRYTKGVTRATTACKSLHSHPELLHVTDLQFPGTLCATPELATANAVCSRSTAPTSQRRERASILIYRQAGQLDRTNAGCDPDCIQVVSTNFHMGPMTLRGDCTA